MSLNYINECDTENTESINILSENVKSLYLFRDHYFEHHVIVDAINRNNDIDEELKKSLLVFDLHEKSAIKINRAKYYYLKGYALNVVPKYSKEAEDLLSKAIKLDPKIVEAWNELGESFCKNNNLKEATNCFMRALNYEKNKVSLRNLSILARQQMAVNRDEKVVNIEVGLSRAKEALQMDTQDGLSWAILGNAYLSAFFGISQNPKTLKLCLSAYNQAEKDLIAKSSPDLHYNKGIMLKYEEEYKLALDSFSKANEFDPNWDPPKHKMRQLLKYLHDINELVATCGKMKAKKLAQLLQSIDSKQLGPYAGGCYTSKKQQSLNLKECQLKELKVGINEEKVVLGKVVCSVHNEEKVPFTFCLVDKVGTCVAVTIYNLADGKGVIIGDSVAIPEPYLTEIHINHNNNEYKFGLIRIETPLVLVINSKKVSRDLQAGVQMSIFKKFD